MSSKIRVDAPFFLNFIQDNQNSHILKFIAMAKRTITVAALADELNQRLNSNQTVDCCKDELLTLANLAKEKMGSEMVEVNWKS